MRVLALMKYGDRAASTRQRLLQYAPHLRARGISIEYLPLLGNEHMHRIAEGRRAAPFATAVSYAKRIGQLVTRRRHDVLWVHSELFPYLPGTFERLARSSGAPIVYDCDDAIFHMYDSHRLPLVRRLLSRKLEPLLKAATACTCGNAYLEAYASRYCDTCLIFPTVVDTELYRPSAAPHPAPLVLGWIGSPSTWRYVQPLLPTLIDVAQRHGAIFRTIGAGPAARDLPSVEALDWSEAREVADVQSMDIGIMPVPDEPWERGKCGYKLIQYMACGLPVVASPVGVNNEIVLAGTSGFLASDSNEWSQALKQLFENGDLRASMGAAGRRRVEDYYALKVHADRLADLLRAVAGVDKGRFNTRSP